MTKLLRPTKKFFQIHHRGFDDEEISQLDVAFCFWIVPRLKRYKVISRGFPVFQIPSERGEFVPELKYKNSWNIILDNMINGFEIVTKNERWTAENKEKVQKAFYLFASYYDCLWCSLDED